MDNFVFDLTKEKNFKEYIPLAQAYKTFFF